MGAGIEKEAEADRQSLTATGGIEGSTGGHFVAVGNEVVKAGRRRQKKFSNAGFYVDLHVILLCRPAAWAGLSFYYIYHR